MVCRAGPDEGLGRDAPHVYARPPDRPGIDEGHSHAFLRGPNGCGESSRTAAQDSEAEGVTI